MKQINDKASKQKKKAIQKQKAIQSKSQNESIALTSKRDQRIDFDAETPMDAFIEQMQSSNTTMFLPTRYCLSILLLILASNHNNIFCKLTTIQKRH